MGESKTTIMEIKVDLCCEKCRKKIKKVLCAIPEIQNQVYNEKTNTVTITVFCCCPENVMRKIRCKGGKTVISIMIVVPEKPKEKPKEKPEEKPKEKEKPKQTEEPKEKEKPKTEPAPPIRVAIVPGNPPPVVPRNTCCRECYEGHNYGPCHYGRPVPCYCGRPLPCYCGWQVPCYDGYGSLVIYDSWGEKPQGCVIM